MYCFNSIYFIWVDSIDKRLAAIEPTKPTKIQIADVKTMKIQIAMWRESQSDVVEIA